MSPKSYETRYKGRRFRSRLEARWAVFFDTLDVPWEYEPKDFNLGDLGRYLPDFRLPWQEFWVEVKCPAPSGEEASKAQALANQTGEPVVIFEGSQFEPPRFDPTAPQGQGIRGTVFWRFYPGAEEASVWTGTQWHECPICGHFFLGDYNDYHRCESEIRRAVFDTLENLKTIKAPLAHMVELLGVPYDNEALYPQLNTPRILEAYEKARESRFEFGQSGPSG